MSQSKVADFLADLQVRIRGLKELQAFEAKLDTLSAKSKSLEKALSIKPSNSIKTATKDQDALAKSVSRTTKAVKGQGDAYSQHFKGLQAQAQAFGKKVEAIQARHTKPTYQTQVIRRKLVETVESVKPRVKVQASPDGGVPTIRVKPDAHQDLKASIRHRLAGVHAQGVVRLSKLEHSLSQSRIQAAAEAAKAEADAKAASYKTEVTRQKYLKAAQTQYQKDMDKLAKAESKTQAQAAKQQENAQKRAAQAQRIQNALLRDKQGIQLRNAQIAAAELRGHAQRLNAVAKNKSAQTKASIDSVRLQAAQSRLQATQARTRATLSRVASGAPNNPYHAIAESLQGLSGRMVGASGDSYGMLGAASGVARFASAIGPAGLALGGLTAVAVGAAAAMKGLVNAGTNTVDRGDAAKGSFYNFLNLAKGDQKKGVEYDWDYFKRVQDLGVNYENTVKDASSAMLNLNSGGMKSKDAQGVVNGVLTFAKAKGLDSEAVKGTLRAIQQMSSKGQAYAEEVKGQLAEHLPASESIFARAWSQVGKGHQVNENNPKDIQSSMAYLNKSMKDGDIKGDKLNQVLVVFSRLLERDANKGGQLDAAKRSNVSDQNRIENQKFFNMISSYQDQDQQLSKSRHDLNIEMSEFEAAARPAHIALGRLESQAMQLSGTFVKFGTGIMYYLNRFLPGGGFQPKTDIKNGAESKAYTDSLAQFKVKDERTGQMRDADQEERADMYMAWLQENRRLAGGQLSDKEYAEQRAYALSTPKEKLQGQMRFVNNVAAVRDGGLRFAEKVQDAIQRAEGAAFEPYRPAPMAPGTNILSPENASRLLQMKEVIQEQQKPRYFGQVERDPLASSLPPVQNVTNNVQVGDIHIIGSDDPDATARAVREELQRTWLDTAAGIGSQTQ